MDEPVREDEDRFRVLFEENVRGLLGYALRRVADPADAGDVVAETFLAAWRRVEDVPAGDEARLWLFGVARRIIANQRRGVVRRSHLADRLRHALADLVVIDHASTMATGHVLRAAMSRLDADDREVLWLTSWEGLTPGQVAVVFDIPPATARSRLHRARTRLRGELEASGWGDQRSDDAGSVFGPEQLLVQDVGGEGR